MVKTQRRLRDPNKPKRGKSAFLMFSSYTRPLVVQEHPEYAFADVAREVARRWKSIDASEREDLEKRAKMDQERYTEEMKQYEPPSQDSLQRRRNKRFRKDGPKRNVSSFMWFCKKVRPELRKERPDASMTDISAMLGKRWNEMTAEARDPYEKLAIMDKERYQRESKAFNETKAKASSETGKLVKDEDGDDEFGADDADYGDMPDDEDPDEADAAENEDEDEE